MPEIACPDPFRMETLHQLAKDGIHAITHLGQKARPGPVEVGVEGFYPSIRAQGKW
jgi:hypothetical protein